MATQTSNIDDLLMGVTGNSQQPATPEAKNEIEESNVDTLSTEPEAKQALEVNDEYNLEEKPEPEKVEKEADTDDYGNAVSAPRTYNEDEVNERINAAIRDRFARFERNNGQQQPNQAQVQQAAQQGFEYNADSQETWQQQLETFVETTVSRMSQKQAQQAQQAREQYTQSEFDAKFRQGMTKFPDFVQTVQSQPITDSMVLGARSMKDPAAFFYAASKRAPQELQRIANIADPYTQIAEIGKLEERMKQSRPGTKTPKPIGRTQEDSTIKASKEKREPTIEEQIAKDTARRLALQKQRRG